MARTIKVTGDLVRDMELDRAAIDPVARTVDVSFSSELPVGRNFGNEILDHSQGSVDLARLKPGPVLMDHDKRDRVGIVENARIEGRRGKATLRFSNSKRAQEVFEEVKGGYVPWVSVGYRVNKATREESGGNIETIRIMSWTPHEISLVSVPADPTVGVGRANVDEPAWEIRVEDPTTDKIMANENKDGKESEKPAEKAVAVLDDVRANVSEMEQRDRDEIEAIVRHVGKDIPGARELATECIALGLTKRDFREKLAALIPKAQPAKTAQPLGIKQDDLKRYSLTRAITAIADNRPLDGLERELSDEISIKQRNKPQGFWVPLEALAGNMTRSFVAGTGTLGGQIVSQPVLGSEFIELLRNKAQVMSLGARTLILDSPVTIPRQNAAGAANWVGETVASTLSVGNFTNLTLTPNGISAFQQYSKQLLATNNPSIDNLVRDDILNILALAIDLAALHGTGSGQPTGIASTTGIGTVTLAANGQALGNATAYPAMVSLETAVSAANADQGALAYLARSAHRGALKIAQRFASTDSPVWTTAQVPGNQPGLGASGGMVNGYRAEVTNQIATNLTTGTATTISSCIFFGNWNELFIGQFNGGATDLVVDPFTLAVNGVVRLIARHWIDIGVRHPASFALLGGIL